MAITKEYGQHVYKNETNGVTPQSQAAPNQQAGYTPSSQVNAAQQNMWNNQAQKPGEYTQGDAVTAAQNKLTTAENNKPGAYQQGSAVLQAQDQLNRLMAGKPQGYTSKYGSQLNSILEQIQNPDKFNWSFDGDELFKYYADLYSQNGKQASMDAMGQAAALTGGYGNSYAQQVGNQAYDEWMRNLYDKGMDLRDRAYQQYQDQRADLYNRYGVLQGADESEYGRYRDTVQDWNADRDYWTGRVDTESDRDYNRYRDTVADYRDERDYLAGRYDTERDVDYGQYRDKVQDYNDELDYWTNLYKDLNSQEFDQYKDTRDFNYAKYRDEVSDSKDERDFQEQVRQFERKMDWENMSNDQKYASDLAMQMLSMGTMPSEAILQAAEIPFVDAQILMNSYQQMMAAGGGSGGGGGRQGGDESGSDQPGMSYEDASRYVLQNTPDNVTPYNTDQTVAELKDKAIQNMANMAATKKAAAQKVMGTDRITNPYTHIDLSEQTKKKLLGGR